MHCTDGFLNCLERWLNGYLAAKCFPQKKSSKTRDTGHILANARMFRSCGDTLFNDLSMFLSALSCTYILSIDIKPLKTLCRKGFACMGTLSAMESLSDALNVLFFALLSGEHYNIFTKVNA